MPTSPDPALFSKMGRQRRSHSAERTRILCPYHYCCFSATGPSRSIQWTQSAEENLAPSQMLNLHSPQIIYIESVARVKKLSLTGKIARLFVDRFFVQWEAVGNSKLETRRWWLATKEYRGILV